MERRDVDVLIVGAGPVGLTAALLLEQLGCTVLIVERRDGPQRAPAAHAINSRTFEIWRQIGLDVDHIVTETAIRAFYRLRGTDRLRKRPSTSELIDWLLVLARAEVQPERLSREVPFLGVLLKKEQDHVAFDASKAGRWRN